MEKKSTVQKLGEFAERKREQTIVNIQNSTATGLILKWLITNRVSVFLFLVIVFGGYYYQVQLDYTRELADKQRIEKLQGELVIEQTKTLELKKKLDKLDSDREEAENINRELRKKVHNLPNSQKKKLLLDYKDRLLKKRSVR
jgi:hypothetical protein